MLAKSKPYSGQVWIKGRGYVTTLDSETKGQQTGLLCTRSRNGDIPPIPVLRRLGLENGECGVVNLEKMKPQPHLQTRKRWRSWAGGEERGREGKGSVSTYHKGG